jgi:flagellar basal body P-ring formation protein FlgA
MRYPASILLILLTLMGTASAGDTDTVTLKESATAGSEYISLGDVAAVKGPHAGELEGLALMKYPVGTPRVTLSAQFVASKIREKLPAVSAVVAGVRSVSVCARQARISGAELEALYRTAVLGANPYKDRGAIEISDVRAPSSLMVPFKSKDLLQAKFSQGEDYLGLVTATISAGENQQEVCRVSGKVRVLAQVPVATRSIRRGELIAQNDLELRTWDISATPLIVADMKECLGMRAKTTLSAGKPLLRSNIAIPPLVSRGDLVVIEARSGGMVVVDRGIALKDGLLGEKVPIRNAGSGRQVVGTIIAHSTVEVTF